MNNSLTAAFINFRRFYFDSRNFIAKDFDDVHEIKNPSSILWNVEIAF